MSVFDGIIGKRLFDATAAALADLTDAYAFQPKRKATTAAYTKNQSVFPQWPGVGRDAIEDAILAARLAQANRQFVEPPPLPPRPSRGARGAPPIPQRPGSPVSVGAFAIPAGPFLPGLGGSDAVKMKNPGICMKQAELQMQKKQAFKDISKNMRDEMRAQNGIPEGLTCARSQTTQAKLAIRGVPSVVAKDTPACGLRDMVDKQARAAASASASNLYRRNLAQAGVPLRLQCKRNVGAARGTRRTTLA